MLDEMEKKGKGMDFVNWDHAGTLEDHDGRKCYIKGSDMYELGKLASSEMTGFFGSRCRVMGEKKDANRTWTRVKDIQYMFERLSTLCPVEDIAETALVERILTCQARPLDITLNLCKMGRCA